MSPKHSSLAFDETVKEFDDNCYFDSGFEPELTVIVNANYSKTPSMATSLDVIQVNGRITVSF